MVSSENYLKALKKKVNGYIDQVKSLSYPNGSQKLDNLLQEIIETEQDLRKKAGIGSRYHIIQNHVKSLRDQCRVKGNTLQSRSADNLQQNKMNGRELQNDEQRVYVYLFNAQGADITSWHKLLIATSLSEHSINRPIYTDEKQLVDIIENKESIVQHGYLAAIINKNSIIREYSINAGDQTLLLLRLKEGALVSENIEYFWHDGKKYRLSKDGYLTLING